METRRGPHGAADGGTAERVQGNERRGTMAAMVRRVAKIGVIALLLATTLFGGVRSGLAARGATEAGDYTIADLGTLPGGTFSVATVVNAAGQVVGRADTATGATHAFLFTDGAMTDLGTLGGPFSFAWGINGHGHVVGSAGVCGANPAREDLVASDPCSAQHAFLYRDGAMQDLGTLGGVNSVAKAINDRGQVAGWSETVTGAAHAFLWEDGVMTDLGALSRYAGLSVGRAINRHGEVVGSADTAGGIHHATIFHRGGMAGLFPIPTAQFLGVAYGINDEGTVVGAADSAGGVPRGFVLDRTSRVLTTLGSLPERPASEAYAINAGGLVVGRAFRPGDDTSLESERAMLWRDDTGVALDHLLTDGAGWTLTAAHSVNDAGQIAGVGTRTGRHRAILLTPAALTAPVPVLGCRRCA